MSLPAGSTTRFMTSLEIKEKLEELEEDLTWKERKKEKLQEEINHLQAEYEFITEALHKR